MLDNWQLNAVEAYLGEHYEKDGWMSNEQKEFKERVEAKRYWSEEDIEKTEEEYQRLFRGCEDLYQW